MLSSSSSSNSAREERIREILDEAMGIARHEEMKESSSGGSRHHHSSGEGDADHDQSHDAADFDRQQ
eukprot:CAMPEP_0119569366 /NCGR_PEP_ID=MMETSP1352-20130426/41394_1 /TAXON_ID=265584 /ORGANISM="Stauroneis constricta, Strain CCMP1120" /LENGTH=66 /DNA_ID=CAMNT_0007618905 /DNA_START=1 /DNA_END=201 /DNA_ORIENTATION=-